MDTGSIAIDTKMYTMLLHLGQCSFSSARLHWMWLCSSFYEKGKNETIWGNAKN